jgi:hypothetical protein
MQHMNSMRVPATVIFSALLVIIMVSASRTTYKFTTEREASALGPCTVPATARDPDPARSCPWPQAPRAFSQTPARKVRAWPHGLASGVDAAAPDQGPPPDDMTARAQHADDRAD